MRNFIFLSCAAALLVTAASCRKEVPLETEFLSKTESVAVSADGGRYSINYTLINPVEGREVTRLRPKQISRFRRERLGFVFQDCNLLDTLTAFENIALALTIRRVAPGLVEKKVRETAQLLEIADCMDKYPYQMSGGQRQRTAAARAIVTDPALVLADEPTGALDSKSAKLLLDRFEALNRQREATILMVTHDAFTASYCHRILFLQDGAVLTQLERGERSRRDFFRQIIGVVTRLGGDQSDVL